MLLAWWCGAFALLALALPLVQAAAARLAAPREARADATSLLHGAALAAALGAAIAFTTAVEATALRWALRAAILLASAAALARWRLRTPAWLEAAALALALVAALALPWRAAERIRANAPPAVAAPAPAIVGARTPLLVIGLDGLEWRKLRPLAAAGRLPTFAKLIDRAAQAPLRTLVPTWSPIVWTTIATGLDEEAHGVRDFSEMRLPGMTCGAQRLRKSPTLLPRAAGAPTLVGLFHRSGLMSEVPVTGCHRTEPAFWDAYSEAGGSVAVVSWYATWPAYPVRGALVSDNNPARAAFQASEYAGHLDADGVAEPPELLARLSALPLSAESRDDALALATPVFSELPQAEREALRGDPALSLFRTIRATDEFAFRSAAELLAADRPELLALYATGIDNVSHRLGKRAGVIDHYYEWIDGLLGALLAQAPADATVLIVSDHGWSYAPERFGHGDAPDGVFLLSGPGVPAGELPASPHVRDVAPTVLALLGLPAGTRMHGEAAWAALPAEVRERAELRPAHAYATITREPPRRARKTRLQDETMERLKALGYVK